VSFAFSRLHPGTNRSVKKNGSPINGVAILLGQTPDLVFLPVRVPGGLGDSRMGSFAKSSVTAAIEISAE
jgi:hypothetical protein